MTARRGMAPLELVLVMPILMSLVATMFWVGKVGSARLTALSDTRGQTWQTRAEAAPGEVLKFDHDPAPSYVAVPVSNPRVGPAGDAQTAAPFGPWRTRTCRSPGCPTARSRRTRSCSRPSASGTAAGSACSSSGSPA